MENNRKWKAQIGDKVYQVECVTLKSLFEIYVDGELELKVPRKMKHDDSDSEYDIRIGGKRCQIVVYDGEPDLCVDGILIGAQTEMDRKDRRNKFLKILGGLFCIITSSYATFLWVIYEIGGKPIFGGVVSLIFIQIFFWGGIALFLYAFKKKKVY